MIRLLFILFTSCCIGITEAQEIPESSKQKLENLTENLEAETELGMVTA